MTAQARRALWLDDQFGGYQHRLLKRQCELARRAGVEILEAPDLHAFVDHLQAHWDPDRQVLDIHYLVLDLMVPQMSGVLNFNALGISTTLIEVHTFGVQLAVILFGHEPPYPKHRRTWKGGLLETLRDVPACILSTNEGGAATFNRYRLPHDKRIDFFWKDAREEQLEQSFGSWLRQHERGLQGP